MCYKRKYPVLCTSHLEEEMAVHSTNLVWEAPWTVEPGGLQFMGVTGRWK